MNTRTRLILADRFRHQYSITDPGVFVVFHDDKPQGWVKALDTPYIWRPGCIAIDTHGNQWQVSDGDHNGVKHWIPINPEAQELHA